MGLALYSSVHTLGYDRCLESFVSPCFGNGVKYVIVEDDSDIPMPC